jgi:hypothetical protein
MTASLPLLIRVRCGNGGMKNGTREAIFDRDCRPREHLTHWWAKAQDDLELVGCLYVRPQVQSTCA